MADVGPYDSEAQTYATPLHRDVRALHDSGRVQSGDPDRLVRNTVLRHLTAACDETGVELGRFDRQALEWIAGLEKPVVQVIIGLIRRAHAGG